MLQCIMTSNGRCGSTTVDISVEVNESLAFLFTELERTPADGIKTVLLEFSSAETLHDAKNVLWQSYSSLLWPHENHWDIITETVAQADCENIMKAAKIINFKCGGNKEMLATFTGENLSKGEKAKCAWRLHQWSSGCKNHAPGRAGCSLGRTTAVCPHAASTSTQDKYSIIVKRPVSTQSSSQLPCSTPISLSLKHMSHLLLQMQMPPFFIYGSFFDKWTCFSALHGILQCAQFYSYLLKVTSGLLVLFWIVPFIQFLLEAIKFYHPMCNSRNILCQRNLPHCWSELPLAITLLSLANITKLIVFIMNCQPTDFCGWGQTKMIIAMISHYT